MWHINKIITDVYLIIIESKLESVQWIPDSDQELNWTDYSWYQFLSLRISHMLIFNFNIFIY